MKSFLAFLPAALWAALIFYLSAQRELPVDAPSIPGLDKIAHGVAFAVLTALMLWAAPRSRVRSLSAWHFAVISSLYGVIDEIHQSFVPPRESDPFDWMADTAGAILTVILWQQWRCRFSPKSRAQSLAQGSHRAIELEGERSTRVG